MGLGEAEDIGYFWLGFPGRIERDALGNRQMKAIPLLDHPFDEKGGVLKGDAFCVFAKRVKAVLLFW